MKTLTRLVFSLFTAVLLLSTALRPAAATGLQDDPAPAAAYDPQDLLLFSDLGMAPGETFLQGPLARTALRFSLPPEWEPSSDGWVLHLQATVLVSNFLVGQEPRSLDGVTAGQVSATLNGVEIGSAFLQGGGSRSLDFAIPPAVLGDPSALQELVITWDATASCDQNVAASLSLGGDSFLVVPHETRPPETDLGRYPRPLVVPGNPFPAPVTLVVPDDASEPVLQGAARLAASLGRLGQGGLSFRVVTAGQLTRDRHADDHLIFVGVTDLPSGFRLSPAPQAANPSDGVLSISASPWNELRQVIRVGGATDEAVLKAATALAGGQVISVDQSTAFVPALFEPQAPAFQRDQNLADLGVGTLSIQSFGTEVRTIPFYLPAGAAIGADAYLDLVFTHSQLLDFIRSGILVRINGVTVGGIRLSEVTANVNTARLIIPASVVHPGMNHLEIQVDITARDACTDPRAGTLFVTILPASTLHLPLADSPIITAPSSDLGAFPVPFTRADLDATTLVVPPDDPASWTAAVALAYTLGAANPGVQFPGLQVTPAGTVFTPTEGNYIVIGQPGRAPALTDLAAFWPVPFEPSGQVTAAAQPRLAYQIDNSKSAGFLEAAVIPGTVSNSLLMVAGNNAQGLDWARQTLSNPDLRAQLQGRNFAVAQSPSDLKTFYVQPATPAGGDLPGLPVPESTPGTGQAGSPLPARPDLPWALSLLFLALVGLVTISILEVRSWRK